MTGPDRRSTFIGALWHAASMLLPLISTVLLSSVIARVLGTDELGAQSLIAYLGSLVSGIVVTAATNCAVQVMATAHGAGDGGRLAALSRLSGRMHLIGGVVAGFVLGAIGAFRDHPLAWVLIGLVVFVDALGWSHGGRLVARHGWRAVSPLRLASQFAASLLGVGAVMLGLGLAGVFGAQLLASAWLALMLRRRDVRARPSGDAAPAALALRPLTKLWGLFILTVGLSEIVDKRVELVFLDAFRSAHEVAVYAVSFSLVTVGVTVPAAVAAASIPGIAAAASASPDVLGAHLARAGRVALLAGCLLAAGLAAVGPSAIVAFWGAGLDDARAVVPWIALSVLFVPLPVLCSSYWTGVGHLAPVLVTTAAGAVVDLGAAAVLVPAWGVAGAVTANVAAQVVTCALIVGYTRRRVAPLGVPLPYAARFVGTAALGGGAAWAVARGLDVVSPLLGLVAGTVVFCVVVGGAGVLAGLVPGGDADWLAETLPAVARPALVAVGGLRWARTRPAGPTTFPGDGVPATGRLE